MRVTSYNRAVGKRAREKVHHVDDSLSVGYQRDGMTGKVLPGNVLSLYLDGRVYLLELEPEEVQRLVASLGFLKASG
jgi:hypothetical protein